MSHIIAAAPGVIGPISLSPWVHFNNAFTALVGYSAEDFRYIEGKTRISTFTEACAICAAYLVIIVGGQQIMRNQSPYQLNTLFKLHNLLLTVVSAVLLVLFLEQVIPNLWTYGIWKNICEAPGLTPPLITLYFVSINIETSSDHITNHLKLGQLHGQVLRITRYRIFGAKKEAIKYILSIQFHEVS